MKKLIDFLRHLPQFSNSLAVTLDIFTDMRRSHVDDSFLSSRTVLALFNHFFIDKRNRDIAVSKKILVFI